MDKAQQFTQPGVIIFRKYLLSYTETFIADQGQSLPTYRPIYCGFQRDSSGYGLIEQSRPLLLEDCSPFPAAAKLRQRLGLGVSQAWLERILQRHPNLIHAHFFNDGIDAISLAERLDIPLVTTVHGHDITKHANASAGSATTRRFFDRVDALIAVSDFIADAALARGCPAEKLIRHYIGIDLEKFDQRKMETEQPSLLFVGRLVEKKGCTYLLQAMARLRERYPGLELTIVGEGDLRQQLQQEALERGLEVIFAGAMSAEQIRDELARCWLFVAPSVTADDGDAEGLGMVFLEAQALHTPVVSFRSGGVVEAVEDGVSGLLCAERDVDALAANISELLDDRCLRRDIGANGRRRVERLFDIRKQCAKLESIYARIA